MKELKPGDRVRASWVSHTDPRITVGEVVSVRGEVVTIRSTSGYDDYYHRKQVRLLKPKRKAREWWINEKRWVRSETDVTLSLGAPTWNIWFNNTDGTVIRTTPPQNLEGWLHVVEKLPKKEKK